MTAEERSCQMANYLAGFSDATILGGTGRNDNGCLEATLCVRGQRRKDAGQRIGHVAVEHVVELRIAPDRKQVRMQLEFRGPYLELIWRRGRVARKLTDRGGRIIGSKLRSDDGCKFRWETAEQDDRSLEEAEKKTRRAGDPDWLDGSRPGLAPCIEGHDHCRPGH